MGLNLTYESDERKVRVEADLSGYLWFVSEGRVEPYVHRWWYGVSLSLPSPEKPEAGRIAVQEEAASAQMPVTEA